MIENQEVHGIYSLLVSSINFSKNKITIEFTDGYYDIYYLVEKDFIKNLIKEGKIYPGKFITLG